MRCLPLALTLPRLITPAMTVLEKVPHPPLLPEAHWPVVLCLLESQCPSATPSSWHQGYLMGCSRAHLLFPCACPVLVIYMHAAYHARAAHVPAFHQQAVIIAPCGLPACYPSISLGGCHPAFIMLGNLLFQRCQCALCSARKACLYPSISWQTMCMTFASKSKPLLQSAAGFLDVGYKSARYDAWSRHRSLWWWFPPDAVQLQPCLLPARPYHVP